MCINPAKTPEWRSFWSEQNLDGLIRRCSKQIDVIIYNCPSQSNRPNATAPHCVGLLNFLAYLGGG